jgi:hypothetical protein
LWDCGTWQPAGDDVDGALAKGDLKFTLDGFKLKGSWVLVRTGGYAARGGKPGRSWLLIKHRDDWAGPIDITSFAPHSVKTRDADLADILAADNPDIWRSHAPARGGETGVMFRRIIEQALAIKQENQAAGARPASKPAATAAAKRTGRPRAAPKAKAPAARAKTSRRKAGRSRG